MYVCYSEGKTEYMTCLRTGYGRRCQAHQCVSRTATLLEFSQSTVSRVNQKWSTTQMTYSQLDTTVGSIGVNMGQQPCVTLSTPYRVLARRIEAVLRQKVFLMFCTLSVYQDSFYSINRVGFCFANSVMTYAGAKILLDQHILRS